jgi:hypothetical protein
MQLRKYLHNKSLQGTSEQRGFPKFSLATKNSGKSKLVAETLLAPELKR